jgi:hypothetical protein
MAGTIKADIVITYPNEEGEWSTLKLTKFEADYLRRALDLAMSNTIGIEDPVLWRKDNPAAYAS